MKSKQSSCPNLITEDCVVNILLQDVTTFQQRKGKVHLKVFLSHSFAVKRPFQFSTDLPHSDIMANHVAIFPLYRTESCYFLSDKALWLSQFTVPPHTVPADNHEFIKHYAYCITSYHVLTSILFHIIYIPGIYKILIYLQNSTPLNFVFYSVQHSTMCNILT